VIPSPAPLDLAHFRDLCRERGLPVTHQREIIYRELMHMTGHPSAEALFARVREHIPTISLATVYANLHKLIDAGFLREVSLHHGVQRLETNLHPHHHLVCLGCREIVDMAETDLQPAGLRDAAPHGYHVQRISVEVQGLCPACAGKGNVSL
jgi:Fur family transcriptional regulator, peroxide stress response regulator